MRTSLAMIALAGIMLSGCISGKPPKDTVTDSTGKTTVIESDRELCEHSCNDDYSRCMETTDSRSNGGVTGAASGMFGESSECRDALSKCMPACKSR